MITGKSRNFLNKTILSFLLYIHEIKIINKLDIQNFELVFLLVTIFFFAKYVNSIEMGRVFKIITIGLIML